MTITARLLRTWSEHVCRDTGNAAATARTLGFAGTLVEHGDYWDITPPPAGAKRALLVKGEAGMMGYLDLDLAESLSRGELDACLGEGRLLPRLGLARAYELAYHVVVAQAPYSCEVIAAFSVEPTTTEAATHNVVLRRDRA